MNVWAVANQKGGVGKTTTTISLGGLLVARKQRTLLIDLDPHGSLTSYLGFDPDQGEENVYVLFQENGTDPFQLIKTTKFERLDVLAATPALATLDRQLGTRGGMGLVISQALARLSDRYDYVLIDCPPMLGVLMVNALAACRRLLIPVQTEFLALKGLERMLHTLAMVQRARETALPYVIVPTLFDRRTRASHQVRQELEERYSAWMWNAVIPIDTQFREASHAGAPLPLLYPSARGSRAYGELLDYLLAAPPVLKVATV